MTDNDSPAFIEVNGVRLETFIPQPIIKISINKKLSFIFGNSNIITKFKKLFRLFSNSSLTPISLKLGFSISNQTLIPLKFNLFATLVPQLFKNNGQIILGNCYCRMTRKPSESHILLVQPSEKTTFWVDAELLVIEPQNFSLKIYSEDGNVWSFRNLNTETYQLRFIYNNQKESLKISPNKQNTQQLVEGLWTGNIETPTKFFQLVSSYS